LLVLELQRGRLLVQFVGSDVVSRVSTACESVIASIGLMGAKVEFVGDSLGMIAGVTLGY
jgi:hypothetical protein